MQILKKVKIEIEMFVKIETEYTENDILEMFDTTVYESINENFNPQYSETELKIEIDALSVTSKFESI